MSRLLTCHVQGNITYNINTPVGPPLAPVTTNVTIGTAVMNSVQLHPGPNSFPIRSITNQTMVLGILNANETTKNSGILPVYIEAVKTEYNGQVIPYFSKALQLGAIYQELPIGKALADAGVGNLLGIGNGATSTMGALVPRQTEAP